MVLFDDTWYHEIIQRYSPGDHEDDTPSAMAVKCLAVANLAAASIIAQGLDHVARAIKKQEQSKEAALMIAESIESLAAAIESKEVSRRESFAAAAMQGLLPNPESDKVGFDTIAAMASDAAGALIKHLDGEKQAEDE
jgi:hypothetical protein